MKKMDCIYHPKRIKVEVDIKEEDAYSSGIVEGRNTRLYQEIK